MVVFLKKTTQKPIFKVFNFHLLTAYTIFFANDTQRLHPEWKRISQGNDGNSGTRTSLIFKTELREHFPDTIKVMVRSLKEYHQKPRKRARLHLVATNGVVANNVNISGSAIDLLLTQEQGFTIQNACAVVQQHMKSKNWKYLFTDKKHNKKSKLADLRTEIDGLNGIVQTKDAVIAQLSGTIVQR